MKKLLLLVFTWLFFSLKTTAQTTIVKYYDDEWSEASKEKATYYAEFISQGENYKCTSYWIKSNALRGISVFQDTVMTKPIGLQKLYYRNGNLEDSIFYNKDGVREFAYHYYENKKLAAKIYKPYSQKERLIEGFDENGNTIKNYVYTKEAEFKGGENAWKAYLLKNVSKDFYNAKDDSEITISVHVQFAIDENGNVIRPKVIKSSGVNYVDADAVRVIRSSPTWANALLYNKPVKVFRVQPFTYVLLPVKKKK